MCVCVCFFFLSAKQFEKGMKKINKKKTHRWYHGTIVALREQQNQVKIHFDGWQPRWDEWIFVDANRLSRFNTVVTGL